MDYRILPTREFVKDFGKLDAQSRAQIKKKIVEVAQDPTRYKHLQYALKGSCRVRIGGLRVIFSYDIAKRELYLEKIVADHRYNV